jgi:D-sedoheptulose 7-phosphate isomerase
MSYVKEQLLKSKQVLDDLLNDNNMLKILEQISEVCVHAINNGNKVMFAGNGGSAADSQHLAAEFVSRFNHNRPGMASIALTTDTSALTAIGNDYGFENLFSRQIEAIGSSGDVFIGISTSGNSKNIVKALSVAKSMDINTVGFASKNIGNMDKHCDLIFRSPSKSTAKIQEIHIIAGHIICGIVENTIYPNK